LNITASVKHSAGKHEVSVATANAVQRLDIAAKTTGGGSAVSGGEFLMLALATCFCNDLYREAARLNTAIDSVEVEAQAEFEGIGLAASNIRYRAKVRSREPADKIAHLLQVTDGVAEIHNTLRAGLPVSMQQWQD
jgi:uncharacterized OsmC-like protein